jgi:hypothetical protein
MDPGEERRDMLLEIISPNASVNESEGKETG